VRASDGFDQGEQEEVEFWVREPRNSALVGTSEQTLGVRLPPYLWRSRHESCKLKRVVQPAVRWSSQMAKSSRQPGTADRRRRHANRRKSNENAAATKADKRVRQRENADSSRARRLAARAVKFAGKGDSKSLEQKLAE
jgi:hypothetical protein